MPAHPARTARRWPSASIYSAERGTVIESISNGVREIPLVDLVPNAMLTHGEVVYWSGTRDNMSPSASVAMAPTK